MTTHRKILGFLALALGVFMLARVALLAIHYAPHFSTLSGTDLCLALIEGVRFDVSVLLTFTGLPLLLLLVPVPAGMRPPWQRCWLWSARVVFLVMVAMLAADVTYFGFVKRHMFDEIVQVSADVGFILEMALHSYAPLTFTFFAVAAGALWLLGRGETFPLSYGSNAALSPVLWLLIFAALIRGSWGMKPLNIAEAFRYGDAARANLMLNGVFTAWHASRQHRSHGMPRLDPGTERQTLVALGYKPEATYPFASVVEPSNARPYRNVVIVLMESWFNHYIDAFGQNHLGVTPNFDRIAQQGVGFPNFFANGSRSIEAIQAVLTSLPATPGQPHLGLGLEMIVRTGLGQVAKQNGMQTLFAQSGARGSFRLEAIAGAMAFDHYFGSEDYPQILDYGDASPPVFGYDYEMLQFMKQQFDGVDGPFCGFLFTGTTHTPFILPPIRRPHAIDDPEGEQGFLNTLYYSDAAIGAFLQAAEASPWFTDTLFVFTGDHTFPKYREFTLPDLFRVPLVLWSPRMAEGKNIPTYGSHIDILPTIARMMGWQGPIMTVGHDLLKVDPLAGRAFIPARNGTTLWIDHSGYVRLQDGTVINQSVNDGECGQTCVKELRAKSLALQGLISDVLQKNRWAPKNL